jgi:hypothetical protein
MLMCEYCVSEPRPRTPEEEARHREFLDSLNEATDRELARRGITRDELLDPDCYAEVGTIEQCAKEVKKFFLLAWLGVCGGWIQLKILYWRLRATLSRTEEHHKVF